MKKIYCIFWCSHQFLLDFQSWGNKSLDFCYLKIIHVLHAKMIEHILENKQKNKCIWIHEIMQLIIIKIKMKLKNRSHRYDINSHRSRHGHEYRKYKKCLTMVMLVCIKQHLSNIWSSIHGKVKQHWGWVEKKCCLLKKSMYLKMLINFFLTYRIVKNLTFFYCKRTNVTGRKSCKSCKYFHKNSKIKMSQ